MTRILELITHRWAFRAIQVLMVILLAVHVYVFYVLGGWSGAISGGCLVLLGTSLGASWNDMRWMASYQDLSLEYNKALAALVLYAESEKQKAGQN